jgi:hypothetical protein
MIAHRQRSLLRPWYRSGAAARHPRQPPSLPVAQVAAPSGEIMHQHQARPRASARRGGAEGQPAVSAPQMAGLAEQQARSADASSMCHLVRRGWSWAAGHPAAPSARPPCPGETGKRCHRLLSGPLPWPGLPWVAHVLPDGWPHAQPTASPQPPSPASRLVGRGVRRAGAGPSSGLATAAPGHRGCGTLARARGTFSTGHLSPQSPSWKVKRARSMVRRWQS